jgi:micrococcal nuclease
MMNRSSVALLLLLSACAIASCSGGMGAAEPTRTDRAEAAPVPDLADAGPLDELESVVPRMNGASRKDSIVFVVEGTIGAVQDGDSLRVDTEAGPRFYLRMSDMDTPEVFHAARSGSSCPCLEPEDQPGQPLGAAATDSLKELAPVGSGARAECYEIDRYGRAVCHVFVGQTNTNLEQIRRGWGMLPSRPEWIRDPDSRTAQQQAEHARRGVWAEADPIHPADWRQQCWGEGTCPGGVTD